MEVRLGTSVSTFVSVEDELLESAGRTSRPLIAAILQENNENLQRCFASLNLKAVKTELSSFEYANKIEVYIENPLWEQWEDGIIHALILTKEKKWDVFEVLLTYFLENGFKFKKFEKTLKKLNVDVNQFSFEHETPLLSHLAKRYPLYEDDNKFPISIQTYIRILIFEFGADPAKCDSERRNALHAWVSVAPPVAVLTNILTKALSLLEGKDNSGKTPLEIAEERLKKYQKKIVPKDRTEINYLEERQKLETTIAKLQGITNHLRFFSSSLLENSFQ